MRYMTFELDASERDLLPDEAAVAFYRQHGYYISPRIFSDVELERALAGSERYYTGERDRLLPDGSGAGGIRDDHGNALRKNDYASLQNDALAAIVRKPVLGAIAARLCGARAVRLWHDQLLYKPPCGGSAVSNVGWHTDRGYWKSCTSCEMLTAWVPFHRIDESLGPMYVIDGSHRFPDNTEHLDFFEPDLEKLEAQFVTGGMPVRKVPMLLDRGQVSFHHCLTIHGSGPNVAAVPRRSIAIHLQPEENRHSGLASHGNDRLVRRINGVPDYTDPAVCPTLWSATSP